MSDRRMIDQRLAAWLEGQADARPPAYTDRLLARTARARQRPAWRSRELWLPSWPTSAQGSPTVRLALLAALVAAALVGTALSVGSVVTRPPVLPPDARGIASAPVALPSPPCWPGGGTPLQPNGVAKLSTADLQLEYRIPGGLDLEVATAMGAVGFGDRVSGLSYGDERHETGGTIVPGARGVIVADVSRTRVHNPAAGPPLLGSDPATFLADLDATRHFTVRLLGERGVGSSAGLAAVVVPAPREWSHIDRDGECALEFGYPSEAIAVDVGGRLVLVQIWARSEEDLRAWKPLAETLIETFEFVPAADGR